MNKAKTVASAGSRGRGSVQRRLAVGVLGTLWSVVVVALAMEFLCRVGAIDNPAYVRARKFAEATGKFRVLIVGDSFSLDNESHACQRLAEQIRAAGGGVMNLAGSGYGPLTYAEMLERFAAEYRPNVILLNYYVGNDLTDSARAVSIGRSAAAMKAVARRSYFGELLFQIRARLYHGRQLARATKELQTSPGGLPSALNLFQVKGAATNLDYLLTNLLAEDEEALRDWSINESALYRCRVVADRVGARMVFSILPSTLQVNNSHVAFYRGLGYRHDARIAKSRRLRELVTGFGRARGIPVVDLLPKLRATGPQELYATNDDHWNVAGNQAPSELLGGSSSKEAIWRRG